MSAHKQTTGLTDLHRFVGGRRGYNAQRKLRAQLRRAELVSLLRTTDLSKLGWQTRIAEQLGVHRSVICRDLKAVAKESRQESLRQQSRILNRREEFKNRVHESLRRGNELSSRETE